MDNLDPAAARQQRPGSKEKPMMRSSSTIALFFFLTIAFQAQAPAQGGKPRTVTKDLQQAEIERVFVDTAKLQNATVMVKLRARAANLLWAQDPERARKMMLDLFKYVEEQKDEYFDREGARTAVLEATISCDHDFAIELLKKISTDAKNDSHEAESRRLARLAYGFVDNDTALAASILEESMLDGVPPTAMASIVKLREREPLLANRVVATTVTRLNSIRGPQAISGLAILSSYLYPIGVYSLPDSQTRASDGQLRVLFFRTSYEVVKGAIATMGGASTDNSGGISPLTRAHLAMLTATISEMSRQYEPVLFVELSGFANQLIKDQPVTVKRLIESQLAMINRVPSAGSTKKTDPEVEITGALSRGDFAAAEKLINEEGDSEHANAMTQLLRRAQLKNFVAKSQLYEALGIAPKIDDLEMRLNGLIDIARAAAGLKNHDLVNAVLSNIKALPLSDQKGLRSRSLFRASAELFAYSTDESLGLVREGIKILNSLQTMTERERSMSRSPKDRLNDANSLIDSVDFNHAFVKLGQHDLVMTFSAADYIEHPAVKISARLASLRGAQAAKAQSGSPNRVRDARP
jgi:hypothetical protein